MNSSRVRALIRPAALALAALALASCAGVHPGSAAVVDGESISMQKADKASVAYCKLALAVAAQQGVTAVGAADTRRQSVTDLVMYKVAKKLVGERGLKVDPATYVLTDDQESQIAEAFAGEDLKEISGAIEHSQETYAIIIALGEEATGTAFSEETAAQIEGAGQAEINKAYRSSDISIDPRFGLDDLTKQVAATGSLSVPEVSKAEVDPAGLPSGQRCS